MTATKLKKRKCKRSSKATPMYIPAEPPYILTEVR